MNKRPKTAAKMMISHVSVLSVNRVETVAQCKPFVKSYSTDPHEVLPGLGRGY